MILRTKVLVYATWEQRLLVFREPDFPEVPLQVPGGTVEPGEELATAARRELAEEAGISGPRQFTLLGRQSIDVQKPEQLERHHRFFFHTALPGPYPDSWQHSENSPDGGGEPIRFELFWLSVDTASELLGGGLGACLPELRQRLAPALA